MQRWTVGGGGAEAEMEMATSDGRGGHERGDGGSGDRGEFSGGEASGGDGASMRMVAGFAHLGVQLAFQVRLVPLVFPMTTNRRALR